ncbi:hypothetical protein ACQEU6_20220 [Spirillospora sp. CA-108201]
MLFDEDAPFAVMVLGLAPDGHRVRGVYAVTNPDKLTRIEDDGCPLPPRRWTPRRPARCAMRDAGRLIRIQARQFYRRLLVP